MTEAKNQTAPQSSPSNFLVGMDKCMECKSNTPSLYCDECKVALCEECATKIHSFKIYKDHKVSQFKPTNKSFLKAYANDIKRFLECEIVAGSQEKYVALENVAKAFINLRKFFDEKERDLTQEILTASEERTELLTSSLKDIQRALEALDENDNNDNNNTQGNNPSFLQSLNPVLMFSARFRTDLMPKLTTFDLPEGLINFTVKKVFDLPKKPKYALKKDCIQIAGSSIIFIFKDMMEWPLYDTVLRSDMLEFRVDTYIQKAKIPTTIYHGKDKGFIVPFNMLTAASTYRVCVGYKYSFDYNIFESQELSLPEDACLALGIMSQQNNNGSITMFPNSMPPENLFTESTSQESSLFAEFPSCDPGNFIPAATNPSTSIFQTTEDLSNCVKARTRSTGGPRRRSGSKSPPNTPPLNPQGGLFGAQAAGGSLFGAPPQGGGLFGIPAAPSSSPGGGLFGQQSAAPAAGGGLFGVPAPAPPAAGGGLFGAPPQAPPQGGGIFGAPPAPSSPPQGGGLFGAPSQGGSLFGAPPAPSSPPQGGSLFGATTAPAPLQGEGGLFGAAAPKSQGGLFGAPVAAPKPQGGLFGAPPAGPKAGEWKCPACEAINQDKDKSCTTCFTARSLAEKQTKPDSDKKKEAAKQESSLFGAPPKASGGLFGTPASDDKKKESVKQESNLFGAPPKASGGLFGAPAPAQGGLFGAPSAGPKAGEWKCPACEAINQDKDKSCTTCFTARSVIEKQTKSATDDKKKEPVKQESSLFGAPPKSSGGLFGAPAPASDDKKKEPAKKENSLFGAPSKASGGLFGAPAPASDDKKKEAPKSQGTSLFGAPAAAPKPQGGLFGAAPAGPKAGEWKCPACESINKDKDKSCTTCFTARSVAEKQAKPASDDKKKESAKQESSLFGAPPKSQGTILFGAPPKSQGGLFGAAASDSKKKEPVKQESSLFGAPPKSSGGLFGAPAPASDDKKKEPSKQESSLFGAPPKSSGGLFGAPAALPKSGSLFGALQAGPKAGEWKCPACETINQDKDKSCTTCFTARSVAEKQTKPDSDKKKESAKQEGSLFGTPPKSQGTILFGAPPKSQGGLFGAAASDSKKKESAKQEGNLFGAPPKSQGGLFGAPPAGPKAGEWKCPACESINKDKDKSCTTCFTARSVAEKQTKPDSDKKKQEPVKQESSLFGVPPKSSGGLFGIPAPASDDKKKESSKQESSLFETPPKAQETSLFGTPPKSHGTNLFGVPPPLPKSPEWICPKCGAINKNEAKSCPSCLTARPTVKKKSKR